MTPMLTLQTVVVEEIQILPYHFGIFVEAFYKMHIDLFFEGEYEFQHILRSLNTSFLT